MLDVVDEQSQILSRQMATTGPYMSEMMRISDIAWRMRNIETGTGRPRLLSDILLKEDRDAVSAELAMLKALHEAEPDLLIVPGHDPAIIDTLIASGALTAQFSL